MALAAIGPCILVAPLVLVLVLLAIPLWPVAIVCTALLWLIAWPLERVLALVGVHRVSGSSRRVRAWLRVAVAPWRLFDRPAKTAQGQHADPSKSQTDLRT